MATLDTFRARSRALRILVTLVFVLLLLVLLNEVRVILSNGHAIAGLVIYRLPMAFYLWAIWTCGRAIASIERGELFDTVVPRLLGRVGMALFIGGIVNVFVTPLLLRALAGQGSVIHFDVAAITVGVVGLTLVVIARLLSEAAAMRRELDEIL